MQDFANILINEFGYRKANLDEKRRFQHAMISKESIDFGDKSSLSGYAARKINEYVVPHTLWYFDRHHEFASIEGTPSERTTRSTIYAVWTDFIDRLISTLLVEPKKAKEGIVSGVNFAFYSIGSVLNAMVRHLEQAKSLTEENFTAFYEAGNKFIQQLAKLPNGPVLHAFMNYFISKRLITADQEQIPIEEEHSRFLSDVKLLDSEHLEFDGLNSIGIKNSSINQFINEYKKALNDDAGFKNKDATCKQIPVHGCPAKFVSVELPGYDRMNIIEAFYRLCFNRVKQDLFHPAATYSSPSWYKELCRTGFINATAT